MSSSGGGDSPGDRAVEMAAKALAMVSALAETLTEIARRLDEYSAFGKRSRQVITSLRRMGIALAVSLALDIALTVALGFTALSAHNTAGANTELVQGLHASQLASCANGNTFRADQDIIWQDFIRILTTPTATSTKTQIAAADKLAAQFLAYVTKVNHPVDCAALYGPGQGG